VVDRVDEPLGTFSWSFSRDPVGPHRALDIPASTLAPPSAWVLGPQILATAETDVVSHMGRARRQTGRSRSALYGACRVTLVGLGVAHSVVLLCDRTNPIVCRKGQMFLACAVFPLQRIRPDGCVTGQYRSLGAPCKRRVELGFPCGG